jgi:hypothetical protein
MSDAEGHPLAYANSPGYDDAIGAYSAAKDPSAEDLSGEDRERQEAEDVYWDQVATQYDEWEAAQPAERQGQGSPGDDDPW